MIPDLYLKLYLINKFFDFKNGSKVLEIGSGVGHFFRTINYMNLETINFTLEPQQDSHPSLKKINVNRLGIDLFDNLTEDLQGSFDLVTMSHVLEHFNAIDISEVLVIIHSILRKNGVFFCEVPNADLDKYPDAGDLVRPHLAFFSAKSISNLFIY